jgi:site-specific DNA-methyltransferase (adenine-specific)
MSIKPYYRSENLDFTLAKGNCLALLPNINFQFKMIFADPPYFLSNGGISVQSGKQVSVNKGAWDKSRGFEKDNEFNRQWLSLCREKLTEDGTIWISGTYHNIFSVAQMLNELGFRILNCITWAKTNPPPNLSCKFFTHSTEFILWARKNKKVAHYYNYQLMKEINGGTQMRDLWSLPAIAKWEKSCGKHPTQKPLPLLARIILASTKEDDWILDPFTGSSTTGIAASLLNRRFLGLDQEESFLQLSKRRREEINDLKIRFEYRDRIMKYSDKPLQEVLELHADVPYFGIDLPVAD